MKLLGYYFFKGWISAALFCYYKKIKVVGLENVPRDKPVLFLSNHQNALLDALLIATRCSRKPWFLTRADVFKNPWLKSIFQFLQMIPVYRMRDGKATLANNKAVFDQCGELLCGGGAILIFPEANHNLKRRVRPLSKGFTRIVENALEKNPGLDLLLVPIGQNYQTPEATGDSAALFFGKPIAVQDFVGKENRVIELKQAVFKAMTGLTTHIEEDTYEEIINMLETGGVDFLDPEQIHKNLAHINVVRPANRSKNYMAAPLKCFFTMLNFPTVFLWRVFLRPRVPEPEFMGTFRFVFVLLGYPVFYALGFLLLQYYHGTLTASLAIVGHAVLNILWIKSFKK